MPIDLKTLNKLAKFARKNGVTKLKLDGYELEFSPMALMHDKADGLDSSDDVSPTPKPLYTDEQILLWSAGGYEPELEDAN